MYQQGDKLIYDNRYPVRFEGREDAILAVVSEDGCHFFARWDMLRRPIDARTNKPQIIKMP